jgi:hypothetical protein
MGENDSEEKRKVAGTSKILDRPSRERVFYANSVNWIFSENQEAILDFKLVMPEDFKAARPEMETEAEGVTQGSANVNLGNVPVEVRVYLPYNQFQKLLKQMADVWKLQTEETKKRETQNEVTTTITTDSGEGHNG